MCARLACFLLADASISYWTDYGRTYHGVRVRNCPNTGESAGYIVVVAAQLGCRSLLCHLFTPTKRQNSSKQKYTVYRILRGCIDIDANSSHWSRQQPCISLPL